MNLFINLRISNDRFLRMNVYINNTCCQYVLWILFLYSKLNNIVVYIKQNRMYLLVWVNNMEIFCNKVTLNAYINVHVVYFSIYLHTYISSIAVRSTRNSSPVIQGGGAGGGGRSGTGGVHSRYSKTMPFDF